MNPYAAIEYETACIEAHYAPLIEAEERRIEEARETWGEIREAINEDLDRCLAAPLPAEFEF